MMIHADFKYGNENLINKETHGKHFENIDLVSGLKSEEDWPLVSATPPQLYYKYEFCFSREQRLGDGSK